MLCSISGTVPEEPVFCVKSGHVYEKRLITKHVEQTGRDPVTQDEVTAADLVPVRNNKLSKPRPVGASSVGGMLSLLQNEYDALLLEGFQLRQELESTRQELSQALYQHDAACRVIARLVKERDAARIALAQTQAAMAQRLAQLPAAAAAADVEMAGGGGGDSNAAAAAGGITEVVVALIKDKNKEFSKARKKRSVPTDTATTEAVASLTLAHSYSHHTSSAPGVLAMDALPLPSSALFAPPSSSASNGLPSHVLTGGADASALLLELPSSASDAPATAAGAGRVTARLKGHAKPVTSVAIVPGGHVGNSESVGAFVTGSADATVRIWGHKQGSAEWSSTAVLRSHRDAVTSVSLHPSLPYVATTSRDGTWAFADVTAGRSLYTHDVVDEAVAAGSSGDLRGFTCGSIHPDGAIYGVGCADRAVRVFDLREQRQMAAFTDHGAAVTCLNFSENGFYMASGAADGLVRIWDLRKLAMAGSISIGSSSPSSVGSVAFDVSGHYLAAGDVSGAVAVWAAKDVAASGGPSAAAPLWTAPSAGAAPVTSLAWGPLARSLLVGSNGKAALQVFTVPA